jgi:hypothetical protein
MRATLRAPSVQLAVRLGYIPDSLTPLVADVIERGQARVRFDSMEDIRRYVELTGALVASAFVEPTVVMDREPDPNANEIGLDDIGDDDAQFVMQFVNTPAGALARFRDEQAQHVEPMDPESSDRASAEQPVEAEAVGSRDVQP